MNTSRPSVFFFAVIFALAGCDPKPARPSTTWPKAGKVELPEFYGVYATEDGKLFRLERDIAPKAPLDGNSAFVVFDRVLGASAMGATVDDIVRIESEGGGRISIAVKPMDKPDMVMVVPTQSIVSGTHTLRVGHQEYPFRIINREEIKARVDDIQRLIKEDRIDAAWEMLASLAALDTEAAAPLRRKLVEKQAAKTHGRIVSLPDFDGKKWTNSLGMQFVPVAGTDVLFSIWETRIQDYEAFARENPQADESWKNPGFDQGKNHPVVNVSWLDAQAFCAWLTKKERADGKIGKEDAYRLPTDLEWSVAVGIGEYPWGNEWPPPKNAGNYDPSLEVDSYDFTSPVGSFPANRHGLYDMGGNGLQWCEDWYGDGQSHRVVRGASWDGSAPVRLLSSGRYGGLPGAHNSRIGFRCVLVVGSSR